MMSDSPAALLSEYSDTEREIFDAALEEFARKGRDGARMQAIADAADINKAMLHYYFRNKETLYEAVFRFTMRRFIASFGASLQEASSFEATLRAFIDGYIDYVRAHEHVMRLMINENLSGGSLVGEQIREMKRSEGTPPQVMIQRIEAAVDAGEIRPVDPHHTILTIVSSCLFFFAMQPTVRLMHPDADDDWDAFVEARKEHLFDVIYRGLEVRDG